MVSVVRFGPWAPTKHLGRLSNCFCRRADAFVRFARCNRFAPKKFSYLRGRTSTPPGGYMDRPPTPVPACFRVIDKMVDEGHNRTVGGATSIGAAHQHGFELFYAVVPVTTGEPAVCRSFNGLNLDTDIGQVGQ